MSWAPGARSRKRGGGITLLELLVTMAIAGMILAISFPSVIAGLDGVRLQTSGRRIGAFLNMAQGRADRDQAPVEIRIDLEQNQISASAADGRWERTLDLEPGVRIASVSPAAGNEGTTSRFVMLPGVPAPRFRIRLGSARGRALTVSVDPLTGTPQIDN
jgi:Tfp pilus assembly protein FimT